MKKVLTTVLFVSTLLLLAASFSFADGMEKIAKESPLLQHLWF